MFQPEKDIVLCVKEDPVALRKFVDKYRGFVMSVMWRIFRNDDYVNDCFWGRFMPKLSGRLQNFDPERDLKPYLWTIARNDALYDLKQITIEDRFREKIPTTKQPEDGEYPTHADPENLLLDKEKLSVLRSVMQSLRPDINVTVLSLRLFGGASLEEIADICHIKNSNVRNRITRAKKMINKKGKNMYPDYFE